jgi:hypothetical protein
VVGVCVSLVGESDDELPTAEHSSIGVLQSTFGVLDGERRSEAWRGKRRGASHLGCYMR